MLPRVYVETTIPSFYYETRTTPDIVARREWTRKWWDDAPARYELMTSLAVIGELRNGPSDKRGEWLGLIKDLAILPIEPAVENIVDTYCPQANAERPGRRRA